ncbi:3'-5' exonuclease [Guptibacillus spartinae]|uniref:3'-5' exonuclease n=1 Tax=Guptibacillus spartinae TaxID=3025679 RepID=UPI0023603A4A|nr:3'-5' exonuclease [Pseudalkalibacillus spartinae]
MNNSLYTIIDFETTGLDAKKEQVTEIAALKIDAKGNEYGSLHTFVRLTNGRKPSPYAKVTEEECEHGMEESEALTMLSSFCKDTIVVAQYAPFDFSFIDTYLQPKEFICTRTLTFMVEPKENPSLVVTCERNNIKVLNAHRAMDDVMMTKEVFLLQKSEADKKEFDYRNVIVDFKKRPLVFVPENAIIINE